MHYPAIPATVISTYVISPMTLALVLVIGCRRPAKCSLFYFYVNSIHELQCYAVFLQNDDGASTCFDSMAYDTIALQLQ
jgi:hypothetical protein